MTFPAFRDCARCYWKKLGRVGHACKVLGVVQVVIMRARSTEMFAFIQSILASALAGSTLAVVVDTRTLATFQTWPFSIAKAEPYFRQEVAERSRPTF